MAVLQQILTVLLTAAALALLLPAAFLLLQMLAAWPISAGSEGENALGPIPSGADRSNFAVLMPAHNESGGVAASIAAVRSQLQPGDRLLVVADNCSDDTAAVATVAGAEVVERFDSERRGKGYALDFGVRHLAMNAPSLVIIVDADCEVQPGALDALARASAACGRPTQALYLMRSPPGAPMKTRIAEFAWAVKNHARPLGSRRLGLPCQLMGSGMAFPWEQIVGAPLASGHIVEDLQLGLDLTARGHAPLFLPSARVISWFPQTSDGLTAQRTRWEHGYFAVMFAHGPGLMLSALRGRRMAPILRALDLCVPPLSFLVLAIVGLLVTTTAFFAAGGSIAPLTLSMLAVVVVALAIGLAWRRFGRAIVSGRELLGVPLYVLQKLPIYLRALRQRQVEWVRTRRDDGST